MKRSKVLLDFLKLSVMVKIGFYRNVIAKLTGNASYPTPDVPLATATTQVDALQTAYVAAQDGGQTPVAIMHEKEKLADATLRKLALYVERIADGNESLILSSGFNVSSQPTPSNRPELQAVRGSNMGTVKLTRKAVVGAKSYIWQYVKDTMPDEEEAWIMAGFSTRTTYEIADLAIASKYWFRVAAVTAEGTTDFSNPIMYIVS